MKTYFHGEVILRQVNKEIPSDATKIKATEGVFKVADSETTGNHHLVEVKEGVELFEKDGILYLKNDVETDVKCVIKERHDNITLEPSIWEITPAQEWDHLASEKRNVAD